MKFGVAILAAGASTRMGRPKSDLPWGTTTILQHLISLWRELGAAQIAVVCRPGQKIENASHIVNLRPDRGMFSSIQSAAAWDGWPQELDMLIFALVDQPQITRAALCALRNAASQNTSQIHQLSVAGKPKHPVALPTSLLPTLARANAPHFKAFLQTIPPVLTPSPDDSPNWDLDTPEDYARAKARFI